MEDLIKAILKRFKTTPKKTNLRNSGMPLETLVERLGKEVAHPHTLIDTVDVKGTEVVVYDIPTLHKKLIMFVGDASTTYQGYVPDECYAKIGQPKVDKGAQIHALLVELEQRGLIHDHDDLFVEDEAVVERFMIERGLMKKPRVSTLSDNEKKKLHEARNVAKVLGGTNLTGSTAQKKWAEKIRASVLRQMEPAVADYLVAKAKFQHSKFWINNRNIVENGFAISNFQVGIKREMAL